MAEGYVPPNPTLFGVLESTWITNFARVMGIVFFSLHLADWFSDIVFFASFGVPKEWGLLLVILTFYQILFIIREVLSNSYRLYHKTGNFSTVYVVDTYMKAIYEVVKGILGWTIISANKGF